MKSSSYVRRPNAGVVRACRFIPGGIGRILNSLQVAALRILVRRSGPAGSSDKDYPTPMGETIPPSTLQRKCFPSPILSVDAFQLNFNDSDSGYMTTSGPCPIFKGLIPVSPHFVFSDPDMKPVGKPRCSAPNTGPSTSRRFPLGVVVPCLSSPASASACVFFLLSPTS
jgi:hypothetical protein